MPSKPQETLNKIVKKIFFSQQLIFIAALILVISFAAYWGGKKQIDGQKYADKLLSEKVGDYIENAISDLGMLAKLPASVNSLEIVRNANNYFDVLYYISADGKLKSIYPQDPRFPAGRDMSSAFFFESTNDVVTISRPFISTSTGNPTVYLSLPLQNGQGIVVGELSLFGLQDALAQSQINPLGIFFIVDQDGYLLANPQYNLVREHVDIRNSGILDKANAGKLTQLNISNGQVVLDIVAQDQKTGYWSIVEASLFDIFGGFLLPTILGLVLMISFVVVLVKKERNDFTRQIINPILNLREQAKKISYGNYSSISSTELKVTGSEEIDSLVDCFKTMKDAIQSRENALAQERNLLRVLIDHLPDAVYTKDLEGRRTLSNFADQQICGVKSESEILGKNVEDLYPKKLADRFRKEDKSVMQNGKVLLKREFSLMGANRELIWINASKIPLMDGSGKISGMLGINQNVTDQKKAELEIMQLNAELEKKVEIRTRELESANRELEAFSYSVSHDLKTPLRAINGYSSLIIESGTGIMDQKTREYLDQIRKASQRMAELIEDLLRLSRISKVPLTLQSVDLSEVAQNIFFQLQVEKPDRKINWSTPDRLIVDADLQLVTIALENLIRNSWKFTGNKDDARIELGFLEENGKKIIFVKDNGVGFNMEYANKLFGAFQRLHPDSDFEGTGIGLAIVKRIINRHGGDIWAEARVNEGATFYFTLS